MQILTAAQTNKSTPDRVDRMMKEWMFDKDRFCVSPSADPAFKNLGYCKLQYKWPLFSFFCSCFGPTIRWVTRELGRMTFARGLDLYFIILKCRDDVESPLKKEGSS